MLEGFRQPSHHFETQSLPQLQRADVGADDKIELHGPKAILACIGNGMLAHSRCNAVTPCLACRDVSAVRHVGATPHLIGAEVVGADDAPVMFGDKGLSVRAHPVRESSRSRHVSGERVRVALADCGFENVPDQVAISIGRGIYLHLLCQSVSIRVSSFYHRTLRLRTGRGDWSRAHPLMIRMLL